MGEQKPSGKPFDISKQEVWEAYKKVRANCSATRWLGTSASGWVGMTGDGKGPADGIGGAWRCPGCRGGGRVVAVSRSRG